ncbi:hypothetical protein OESDEN_14968 [Oesophagostomum dentatum]|uniref:Uncharacterized protein n=1 Tax=Oesophagostomum dentatum TaxID=61180 RepID=A0A0B1SK47_OESDE|nr:hypothetical protein OESDEN_14968 [Oesophagostomum dentatum]
MCQQKTTRKMIWSGAGPADQMVEELSTVYYLVCQNCCPRRVFSTS